MEKIKNNSQLQIAVYYSLYLSNEGKMPRSLSNASTKFRNNVVHNGYFANKEESFQFGEDILNLIKSDLSVILKKYKNEIIFLTLKHLAERKSDLIEKIFSTIALNDSLFIMNDSINWKDINLEMILADIGEKRNVENSYEKVKEIFNPISLVANLFHSKKDDNT